MNDSDIMGGFLSRLGRNKPYIAVIGDLLVDEYYQIGVNRISPEFPIQVMQSSNDRPVTILPGGAGNVAAQINALGAESHLFCLTDNETKATLKSFNFLSSPIIVSNKTPRKRRFYNGTFPLMRWDVENMPNAECKEYREARERLLKKFEEHHVMHGFDAVIISDYNKGLIDFRFAREVIDICRELEIPTIVDPKTCDLSYFKGCTIYKPNAKEHRAALQNNNVTEESLLNHLDCEAVVVTTSEDGATLYRNALPKVTIPHSKPVKARSVIGAGDCFLSLLTVAYALDIDLKTCVSIANLGSAAYVQKELNSPISISDLQAVAGKSKRTTPQELSTTLKDTKQNVVFTNGCFDILTAAHINTINFAKKQGDVLIVALDTDENVKRLKGSERPINTLEHRMSVIEALAAVDYVISFEGTPDRTIGEIGKVDVLVKGGDYNADDIIGRDLVKKVVTAPLIPGVSTTNVIKKAKNEVNRRRAAGRAAKQSKPVLANSAKDGN